MEFKTVLRISLQYTSVISPREGEIYFLSLHVALEIKLFQDSGRHSLTTEGMFCIHGVFPDRTSLLWANRAGPCLVEMLVECRTCWCSPPVETIVDFPLPRTMKAAS